MTETALRVSIVSTSNASDLGYLAVRDLATAMAETEADEPGSYRIIGGHMVQLAVHAFPVPGLRPRATTDADAGISRVVAASRQVHVRLESLGYHATAGNSYTKAGTRGPRAIDLLVPTTGSGAGTQQLGDRGFDAAPGLSLALSAAPLLVAADVRLQSSETITFTVPIPSIEAAVALKALVWKRRSAVKDLTDLGSLFEIVDNHRNSLASWKLDDVGTKGVRGDTRSALQELAGLLDRRRIPLEALTVPPHRLAALIRRHVAFGSS